MERSSRTVDQPVCSDKRNECHADDDDDDDDDHDDMVQTENHALPRHIVASSRLVQSLQLMVSWEQYRRSHHPSLTPRRKFKKKEVKGKTGLGLTPGVPKQNLTLCTNARVF